MIIVMVGDQRANTGNRVIDVFGDFVSEFGANFVIALAVVNIRRIDQVGTASMSHTRTWGLCQTFIFLLECC
jgi:hypothetical protein